MEFLVKETNLVWIICESRTEVINFHEQVAIYAYLYLSTWDIAWLFG